MYFFLLILIFKASLFKSFKKIPVGITIKKYTNNKDRGDKNLPMNLPTG